MCDAQAEKRNARVPRSCRNPKFQSFPTNCSASSTSGRPHSRASARFKASRALAVRHPTIQRAVACAAGFGQIRSHRVERCAPIEAQILGMRDRMSGGAHPREPRPNRAFLAHLVRLEDVEVSKVDGVRVDDDRSNGDSVAIQPQSPGCPHDDAVETFVVTGRAATRPDVRCDWLGRRRADVEDKRNPFAVQQELAERRQHPAGGCPVADREPKPLGDSETLDIGAHVVQ